MGRKVAIVSIAIVILSLAASHVYSEWQSVIGPPNHVVPLTFSNETPDLSYVRYFTNASRVLVLFEEGENAEKFVSFVGNNSIVIISTGIYADVLMKRDVLIRALELADYSDVMRLPTDNYWSPQRIEKEYRDLNFLLTNYSFPEPIRGYLLNRFRERREAMERIEWAKNFMLAHKGLEFYQIELINPSYGVKYPDLSSDLMVILLVETVLMALMVLEKDRKIRAAFLISFLLLMIPTHQLVVYERDLNSYEKTIAYITNAYITKMPEKSFNRTSYTDLNGGVDISCQVKNAGEVEDILKIINSSGVLETGHSLRGRWLRIRFVDENPQKFLLSRKCSLDAYGYNCRRNPTEKELQVINRTREVLKQIPADKRYPVKEALSRYNTTIHECDSGYPESIPPGKYMVSLHVFPESPSFPDLQLALQMIISAVVILLLALLFEGEEQ